MGLRLGIVSYDGFPPQGGQGVYVSEVVRRLPEHGVEPVVFCARGHGNGNLVSLGGGNPLAFSLRASRALPSLVRRHQIEVVHAQGGPGGVMLLRHPRAPLVYTAHHLYSQQRTFLGATTLWRRAAYRLLQRVEARGYAMARGVIAVSSTTASALVQDYRVPEARVHTIAEGVDTQVFHPLEEEKLSGSLLFVGRLHRRKGLHYLIQAMPAVLREVPDARLYVIGRGEWEGALKAQVHRLSLAEAVVFLGWVEDGELPRWYNRAQVFVLPSLLEGFGLVCLEAMACGTPVVTTRVPGVVDIVADGETGLVVPPEDTRALSEAIIRLLRDAELRREMRQRGLELVQRRFTWDRVVSHIAAFYRHVAG